MEVGTLFTSPQSIHKNRKKIRPYKMRTLFLAWLISGCALFGEIMPFGAALYAAEYTTAPPVMVGVIAVLATLFPGFFPAAAIKYLLALFLFSLIAARHGSTVLGTPLRRGGLMALLVFASGLFMLLGGQILLYDCFILVLEAGITCAAVCLFAHAKSAFSKGTTLSAPLDVLSVSALMGVAILGVSNLTGLYGLYLTLPLSVLAILLLTHESGLTSGAVAGITIGLLATLESGNPVLGSFAAAGMAAGYFSCYGRAGAALAFVCTNAAISFYIGGSTEAIMNLSGVLAPTLIYLALPHGLLGRLTAPIHAAEGRPGRVGLLLCEELREKAAAFSYLSCTFSDISEKKQFGTHAAAGSFFEKTARRACEGCSKLSFCWNQEFHRTYAAFFVMLEICTKAGRVEVGDIPISLEEKCLRPGLLLDAFNQQYAVYKQDLLWETRMQEARQLIARQLSSVAHIMEVMEKNIRSGQAENTALENLLRLRLSEKRVPVRSLSVTDRGYGSLVVALTTDEETLPAFVSSVVSEALQLPMEITSERKGHIRLCPTHRMYLSISGETVPRDGSSKSGDSFDSLYLENGCYLMAISDGMGSGEKAGHDSRAAVNMLSAMFSAGFDAETAVGLVNSVLVLKSAEETFATLDLLLINARNFEAEFIKAGAAASFLKRGNAVRTFAAGSLPAGILSSPDPVRMRVKLCPGDFIVMLSDGIADPACNADSSGWLEEAIRLYDGDDPHALCHILLQKAREKGGNSVRDDMTVLCAVIREKDDFVA
ncbi:MAG: hypothetical protein E7408_03970 [Ruminococcaceae bacterium]|nr:hypothetical protein [Oscillospiraceae bacterium]